jgi:hypothetical protein
LSDIWSAETFVVVALAAGAASFGGIVALGTARTTFVFVVFAELTAAASLVFATSLLLAEWWRPCLWC